MYFHYPTWLGSMPDPSLVPPPPVVFKPYYFKPEKSTSANHDKDHYKASYAEDDIGIDYGPEYVRPVPYPPPPNPPKKEEYFDYWTYTRVYNTRPYPFPHAHEYPSFSRARQYGYSSTYDYRHAHSHIHTHTYPHPHTHPQPHTHTKFHTHPQPPRDSWSTQDATKAWRAKQRKIWEEWERRTGEARAPPSSNTHPSEANGGWREGWYPPRSPSPSKSDNGWQDRSRSYPDPHGDETDPPEEQWSWDYRTPRRDVPLRQYSSPSETRLSEAFAIYCKIWETLLSPDNSKRLMFQNIPWPQYPSPRSVEDINVQNVRAFLMAAGRPLKVCLREALLRFHPDKTAMLLAHVAEKDKMDVAAGCEAVTRCLSQLMKSATL